MLLLIINSISFAIIIVFRRSAGLAETMMLLDVAVVAEAGVTSRLVYVMDITLLVV